LVVRDIVKEAALFLKKKNKKNLLNPGYGRGNDTSQHGSKVFCAAFFQKSGILFCLITKRKTTMPKAIWNDIVIAESNATVVVENNHYFPLDSVNADVLRPSTTTSRCPWKGTANYYSIEVAGAVNKDAAWYYADPSAAAAEIKGRVAFWKGVKVVA
jgi:uncharacterized protein (DUF427 family)